MRLLSPIASIMRGSVAGLTFTANQYHQIVVRQKTAPVNPSTTFQSQMRAAFSNASVSWKSLAQSVRDEWNDYSGTVSYPGPLGTYKTTGRNIFIANLAIILYINARGLDTIAVNTSAPIIPGVPSWGNIETVSLLAPGTGFQLKFLNPGTESMNYFAEISPPQSPSRLRYKGPWISSSALSDEVAAAAAGVIDYVGLTEGAAYFVRLKGVVVSDPHRSTFAVLVRAIAETVVV